MLPILPCRASFGAPKSRASHNELGSPFSRFQFESPLLLTFGALRAFFVYVCVNANVIRNLCVKSGASGKSVDQTPLQFAN